MGPQEAFGPDVPAAPDQQSMMGPQPVITRPVVLVFGPGLARGFAYVGVLRAFNEAKIPVAAVLGTEIGGLIGTVYASEGEINKFEFALQRLKDEVFLEKSSLISRLLEKPGDGKALEEELVKILGSLDLSNTRLPVRVALQPENANDPVILNRGRAVGALRAAMAVPGFMTVSDWEGGTAMSADSSRPYLVSEAKALNLGPVIVVDVLSDPDKGKNRVIEVQMNASENLGSGDLKAADLVIRPKMKGISYLDFQKRTEAAFRGKTSVIARLPEIRKLVGAP